MLNAIFETLTDIVEGFIGVISSLFTNIVELFWTPGVGEAAGSLTFLGILLLISVGVSLVYFGYSVISRLIRSARR